MLMMCKEIAQRNPMAEVQQRKSGLLNAMKILPGSLMQNPLGQSKKAEDEVDEEFPPARALIWHYHQCR
ncbi:hypothetical protein ACTXT7_002069 [Hymenolepis weldensis]